VKYLVAAVLIGVVAAAVLTFWRSADDGTGRDRARARWKVVDLPPGEFTPGSVWIALTGPSGYEFNHKKVGTYTDLPRQILLQNQAESSAKFLNDRIPENRHVLHRKP
jgi:hypothetical protein